MQKIKKIIANTPEISVILALALIMTVTAIANSNFLSVGNMTALLKSIPFIALATLGCSLCLNCGVLDISIGRVAGLCGMVFGYILDATGSLIAALACGIGCGLLFGFINAFLSINVGVDSFIVTMGTLYVAGGLRYMINSGDPITLPESYRNFSQATPLGISWFFWIVLAIFVIVGFMQKKTVFGRRVYACGSNAEVAKLQGVNVNLIRFISFLICGLFAGMAGVMATIDINSSQPASGTGWEFKAIAACVIGGASLSGGKGRSFGVALGVFVVFIINNIINMMDISNYYSNVFTGCVLAGAVLVDIIRSKKKIRA